MLCEMLDNFRLTIRPGFPRHVLFFGPCPGVQVAFQKCPGFNQFVPGKWKIRLLSGFSPFVSDRLIDRYLITYFSVL